MRLRVGVNQYPAVLLDVFEPGLCIICDGSTYICLGGDCPSDTGYPCLCVEHVDGSNPMVVTILKDWSRVRVAKSSSLEIEF